MSLRDASLSVAFEPVDRIERDPPLSPNLEVQVRAVVARLAAHVADHLPLEDALAFHHRRGVAQIPVEAVIAASVVELHRGEVCPERPGEAYDAARDGAHWRPLRRRDPDAVPRDPRLV